MKAKVIHSNYHLELETMLNDFIADKDVTDCQFTSTKTGTGAEYTVLITYEE